MQNNLVVLIVCITVFVAYGCHQDSPSQTTDTSVSSKKFSSANYAAKLLTDIEQQGAESVLSTQFQSSSDWEVLLAEIQSGIKQSSTDWYSVAKKLRLFTDASKSEGLRYIVARAMADNPQFVLEKGDETFDIDYLCTIPFIEADSETIQSYLDRLRTNINLMPDGTPKSAAQKCYTKLSAAVSG